MGHSPGEQWTFNWECVLVFLTQKMTGPMKYLILIALLFPITAIARDLSTEVRRSLEPFIEDEEISGAVALVARGGKILSFEALGDSDIKSGRAMRKDDLFWIASMTKPLAGVSIMMLQEEGELDVHDLVETHLPEFKDLWLFDSQTSDSRTLKRPSRKITLFDLLTHTAGVPNVDEPRSHTTLGELVAQISQQPLVHEPGSRWKYSSGGINVLGRVVEVVSGQRFDAFIQNRILDPVGMRDTAFFPAKSKMPRIAKSYLKNEDVLELTEIQPHAINGPIWDRQRTVEPSGGLYSTAEDMRRFYQMMLDGGIWKGKRLLSEESVRQLTRTQTGEILTGFTDGMSWGLAFQVVKNPQGVTAMLSPGTFGHGGAYGTQSWADPVNQTIYILMIQRRGFKNGDNSPVRKAFQEAAQAALND